MRIASSSLRFALLLTLLPACSSESTYPVSSANGGSSGVAGSSPDSGTAGAGAQAGAGGSGGTTADASPMSCDEKAATCASDFGSLFTKSNGRADGTLVALVRPVDQQCALPNSTHVTLQLSILGQVQRLVASVDGVAFTTVDKPLLGPPYAEGWHVDQNIDYVTDLGVHSTDFTEGSLTEAVDFLCSHLDIGAPVSVFAYSDGSSPSSAHQIHRNDNYPDGAIVVSPTSATPTYLLFRYLDQTF
jgi:hypothetical protein